MVPISHKISNRVELKVYEKDRRMGREKVRERGEIGDEEVRRTAGSRNDKIHCFFVAAQLEFQSSSI